MRAEYDSMRISISKKLEDECVNCGVNKHLHMHHIVPLALGGTNNIGNIVKLCEVCHGKVHGADYVGRRRLQAEGIEAAKRRGQTLGRPKINYATLSDDKRNEFKREYKRWKDGKQTAVQTFTNVGLTKNTFYKIVKEYEALGAK